MNRNKLLIIDGHNLLFQMFYGMPSRIVNKDGKAIQGVLGFVGALIKIIKMTEPSHAVALFDCEKPNERCDILPEYKANRIDYSDVPEERNPFSQLGGIYRALDFIGIRHTEVTEFETDDVIASYAITYGNIMEIVISSWDSDYFQLINENVSVMRYRGKCSAICDTDHILKKFGISPAVYADFKALTGDKADNIRGADKVGTKTAAALINQFGDLETVLQNADKIAKPSIRESVSDSRQRLRNNYEIIKLTDRAELPFDIGELKYSYDGIRTNDVLKEIGVI